MCRGRILSRNRKIPSGKQYSICSIVFARNSSCSRLSIFHLNLRSRKFIEGGVLLQRYHTPRCVLSLHASFNKLPIPSAAQELYNLPNNPTLPSDSVPHPLDRAVQNSSCILRVHHLLLHYSDVRWFRSFIPFILVSRHPTYNIQHGQQLRLSSSCRTPFR
jgi:hypothetical protein